MEYSHFSSIARPGRLSRLAYNVRNRSQRTSARLIHTSPCGVLPYMDRRVAATLSCPAANALQRNSYEVTNQSVGAQETASWGRALECLSCSTRPIFFPISNFPSVNRRIGAALAISVRHDTHKEWRVLECAACTTSTCHVSRLALCVHQCFRERIRRQPSYALLPLPSRH